jgi:integrase
VTLHGLRRTFASLAEWVEMPRGIVAQIMGHAPNATAEKHYINRPLELLAVWHGKYEGWILEQAGVAFEQGPSKLTAVASHSKKAIL